MAEEKQWRTSHYKDLPQGDVLKDHLSEFWLISDEFGMENLSMSMGTIAPGDAGPMHFHDPPVEEVYLTIEGRVDHEIKNPETDELEVINARPGTVTYFPPNVPHRPINRYDEDAVQLAIRTQGGSAEEMKAAQNVVADDS